VANYLWNDESQLERFIKENRWENGNENRVTKAVNSARPGDVLFAKSTWVKGKAQGILTIRAIGLVKHNPEDGHNLDVNWYKFPRSIDLNVGSHYRYTFQLIREAYLKQILEGVLDNLPDLEKVIGVLEEQGITPKSPEQEEEINNMLTRTRFDHDGAYSGKDLLDIENDVRSFALLLAAKAVEPPLAIALFGKWGSGKSFFMKHLQTRIDELSTHQGFLVKPDEAIQSTKEKEDLFCRGIAQIEFNAWSYLDANLWAGLVSTIFEKLDEYIRNRGKGEAEKMKIRKKLSEELHVLSSEKKLIIEKKEDLEHKREELKSKIEELKRNRETLLQEVADKQLTDLTNDVRRRLGIEESLKKKLNAYGITADRIDTLNPGNLYNEVTSWYTFIRNLGSFNWKFYLLFGFSFLFLLWIIIDPFSQVDQYKEMFDKQLGIFLGIAGPVFIKAYHSFNKFKNLILPLTRHRDEFNQKLEEARFNYQRDLELLKSNLLAKDDEIRTSQEQIKSLDQRINLVEYSIDHFIPQKAFNNFIRKRIDEKHYDKHIGLISIIRRDFEVLSDLFTDHEVESKASPEVQKRQKERRKTHDDLKKLFKEERMLDRIILYIDDLDRCSDDKVLEVIQAVHLLMAFPLFNVVVGVDKRCIRNALLLKTKLEYRKIADLQEIERIGIEMISPGEYLEKIFQIPFELKDCEPDTLKKLAQHLLDGQVEERAVQDTREKVKLTAEPQLEDFEMLEDADMPDSMMLSESLEGEFMQDSEMIDVEEVEEESESIDEGDLVSSTQESLSLSELEAQRLKGMIIIVGTTPRTVKRFLNIYRIIRSHALLKYKDEAKEDIFLYIMFLLAIGIGTYRSKARELFHYLQAHKGLALTEVLKKIDGLGDKVITPIQQTTRISPLLDYKADNVHEDIIPFVARFSFFSDRIEGDIDQVPSY
jgi:hypothetical protein